MPNIHYMSVLSGGNYLREVFPKLGVAASYSCNRPELAAFEDKLIMDHRFTPSNLRNGASRLLRSPVSTAEAMYKFEVSYFTKSISPDEFLDIPFSYAAGGLFNLGTLEEYYILNYLSKINGCSFFKLEEIRSSPEYFTKMFSAMGFSHDTKTIRSVVIEQGKIDKDRGMPHSGKESYPEFENRAALLSKIMKEDFGYSIDNDAYFYQELCNHRLSKSDLDFAIPALLRYYAPKFQFYCDDVVLQKTLQCFLRLFSHAPQLPTVELMLAWSLSYFREGERERALEIFDDHFEKGTGLQKYFIAMLRATFDKEFLIIAKKLHYNYFLPSLSELGRGRLDCDLLMRQQEMDRLCRARGYSIF